MPPVETLQATPAAHAPNVGGRRASFIERVVADLSAGTVVAFVTMSYAVSYAALVFSGTELHEYLSAGVTAALMSSWVMTLIIALGSSWYFAQAGPDSNLTAVLAALIPLILAALLARRAAPVQISATILAAVAISALTSGALALALGLLRQGRSARFIPYPVSGGFLAGTGFLIAAGGIKVLTGQTLSWTILGHLGTVSPIAVITTGLVVAALLLAPRFTNNFLVIPVVLLAGAVVFYALLAASGQSVSSARASGLLLQELPSASVPAYLGLLGDVRWDVLAGEWSSLLAMAAVAIITIALNAAALDMDTHTDADFDRELRVSGLAGIVAGIGGGMVGCISLSRSALSLKAGARTRLSGIWAAAVCLATMLFLRPLLALLPTPLLAGLLLFLGLSMLRQWLWASYFRLPIGEYALVLAIMLVIVVNGLIAGIGFGLLAAACLFVYHYGQIQSIRNLLSGSAYTSNRERSPEETNLVRKRGVTVRALCLQGYIFFGTSSAIMATCRRLIEQDGVRYLGLDFRLVQGVDVSSVAAFQKLINIADGLHVTLVFSDLSDNVRQLFDRSALLPDARIRLFPDLDHALEWIEDQLLGESSDGQTSTARLANAAMDINELLENHFTQDSIKLLREYCEAVRLQAGEALFQQGDIGEELYMIEEGSVSVLLRGSNGRVTRLRTFGPGTIVGEMALYTKLTRSALVQADAPCRLWKLSAKHVGRMERVDPGLAVQFHAFIVKVLATRLAAANQEIQALS